MTAASVAKFGRVGVLYGGTSSEREVSLQSGEAVYQALLNAGVEVVALDLQQDPISAIQQAQIDRAFIALHGPGGEDGAIQALLTIMGIGYTGSGVQASALAMDKLKTKYVLQALAIPTPPFAVLSADSDWVAVMNKLGGAAMVKPAHEGSSIGMSKVHSAAELQQAYQMASQYDRAVFAEALITGAEYTVAILGGQSLPAIKLETDNAFYDYDAKYISNETRYLCPCGLSGEPAERLQSLALASFQALDCRGWGRVDFMADSDGNFFVLEVNTVPGMTSHSLVPMAAKAVGLSFDELCVKILELID
ncbi:D-alanine--D-alanine ligase [Halioxenophilus sp. WMMB6]|uniref:D-alanine--D-alanine ligase n=1 Tax=Halioxenophilus sp. WMMB6 TaxID=3073815 RepID=UPI00295E8E4C|nr:D-alanine--D-alanine ligase [Halioxenophilus sp. WMMB6]